MSQQPTHDEVFHLYNSYFREHMTARFYRRIFNAVCFLQVVLGSTFMANIAASWFAGFVVTLLSAYMFVCKPGEISSAAKAQSLRYEKLIQSLGAQSDRSLRADLAKIVEDDIEIPGALINPAYIRAAIATGCANDDVLAQLHNLTLPERIYSFIAGGIPK
ncbi:hypothetical protein ACTWOG_000953 [Serratia marcescens]